MTIRPVLRLPHDALTTPAVPVGSDRATARRLAEDLVDTMRASPACVGLAAPQIGVGLRAFAMDVTGHRKARTCHGLVVLFDPEILSSGEPTIGREGCMSVPDLTGDVARAMHITVRGTTADGGTLTIESDAFEARALQHEIDHLDGKVFLDRVAGPNAIFTRRVYK